jgi:hypothetical protein
VKGMVSPRFINVIRSAVKVRTCHIRGMLLSEVICIVALWGVFFQCQLG